MIDREALLFNKLAEECTEVGKVCMKIQQYGLDDVMAGQDKTNRERLHEEIDDFLASVKQLNEEMDLRYEPDAAAVEAKIARVNHYAEFSRSLGYLVDKETSDA